LKNGRFPICVNDFPKGFAESKTRKAKGAEVNILHKKRWFDVKKLFFNKNILDLRVVFIWFG
jgi:hypothetical protein